MNHEMHPNLLMWMLSLTQKEKISLRYDLKKPERCMSQAVNPALTCNDSNEC